MEFSAEGLSTEQLNALLLGAEADDSLDASDNDLCEWPDAIRHFAEELRLLSLSSNRLTALPPDLRFPVLEYVYLFRNRLADCS